MQHWETGVGGRIYSVLSGSYMGEKQMKATDQYVMLT